MKITVNTIRILTGLLFIFSGIVKANDPLGTAYKMEEYFEVWSSDLTGSGFFLKDALLNFFHFLDGHNLFLSVLMNGFEIIAGASLLVGWRMKLMSRLLLLLMIFFTILTGYTYQTGRPTNCGCFGDCLKITPQFSFFKDIVLTAFILLILFFHRYIKPVFRPGINTGVMFLVTFFAFGLQWYALKYLPPVDCLPFKKGNNISEKMKIPANAVPDSVVMTFVYKKGTGEVEFPADKFPEDFNDSLYQFVNRYDKLIRKGKNNEPPIKGFSLSGTTNQDSTEIVLQMPYVLLLFEERPAPNFKSWEDRFMEIKKAAMGKNIPLFAVTTSIDEYRQQRGNNFMQSLGIMKCDFTAIRTAARVNPTMYLLSKGTVKGKWSYKNFNEAMNRLETLDPLPAPVAPLQEDNQPMDSATATIPAAEQQ